jgi:hypothetical protein
MLLVVPSIEIVLRASGATFIALSRSARARSDTAASPGAICVP